MFLAQLLKSSFCASSWRICQCLRGLCQCILLCPLMFTGCTCLFPGGVRKQVGFSLRPSVSLGVLLRYWVRFQRNCFILWAISTFLKFRHFSDPVPQIPLKCFCQMVYQSKIMFCQLPIPATLKKHLGIWFRCLEFYLSKIYVKRRQNLKIQSVHMRSECLLFLSWGRFLGIPAWSSRCVSLFVRYSCVKLICQQEKKHTKKYFPKVREQFYTSLFVLT